MEYNGSNCIVDVGGERREKSGFRIIPYPTPCGSVGRSACVCIVWPIHPFVGSSGTVVRFPLSKLETYLECSRNFLHLKKQFFGRLPPYPARCVFRLPVLLCVLRTQPYVSLPFQNVAVVVNSIPPDRLLALL